MRAQLGGLGLFVLSTGLFLFVGHQVRTVAALQKLTWWFIGTGGLAVTITLIGFNVITIGPIEVFNARTIGSAFWVWVVAISLSQALCNRDLLPAARLGAATVAIAALARGLVFAFSWASGWLPPLVTAAVIVALRFPRTAIVGAVLLAGPAVVVASPVFEALLAGGESYSWMTRVEAARLTLQMLAHSPLIGFGPANYYEYTVLFPILGWWVRFNSHNNYIDVLAQTGVLGLLAFAWFAMETLLLCVSLAAKKKPGFVRAYLTGALAGLVGTLVAGLLADWIVPFAYNLGLEGFRSSLLIWLFLGGVLSLKRILSIAPNPTNIGIQGRQWSPRSLPGAAEAV
jgi:hypothetical protein